MNKNLLKQPNVTLLVVLILLAVNFAGIAQSNTWTLKTSSTATRYHPALIYAPVTKEFILTIGSQNEDGSNSAYTVQSYRHAYGKWINSLPNDTLYGKWADSTGFAYGKGMVGPNAFGTYYWTTGMVDGYLRPNIGGFEPNSRAYKQFCYNTDDGKIYFYVDNVTITYNPVTRLWEQPVVNTRPGANGIGRLKWGSLCYDAYNKEIVLFGGCGYDTLSGSVGTWTFKPATNTWTKLNLTLAPGGIANSPLVYDPVNHVIVMFGGDHLDELRNQTWVYDCPTRTWSKKNPSVRPSPRGGHAFLYLPKSKKIVLIGGYNYQSGSVPEMWTYDVGGNAWNLIKHFGTEVFPKYVTYKPAMSGVCDVDKGDTIIAMADEVLNNYGFTPSTYQMVCNGNAIDAAGTLTYGFTKDSISIRGGYTEPSWYTTGVPAPDIIANENFLVNIPLNTWTNVPMPKNPGVDLAWGTAMFDPDRDQILRWSGGHAANCATSVFHFSIPQSRMSIGFRAEFPVEYDGYNDPNPGPFTFNGRPFMPMHTVKSYAYDVISKKMIYNNANRTRIYNIDNMDWEKAPTINAPWVDTYGSYMSGLCSTPHGVYATNLGLSYLFDGVTLKWKTLPQTGALTPFYSDNSGVVYDSKRDRIITMAFTGGTESLAQYDFASGKATVITPVNSAFGNTSDHFRESVYIPELDIVLFQIHQSGGHLAYDCANNQWIQVAINNFNNNMDDRSTGLMYDKKRQLVWLQNGSGNVYVARLFPETNGIRENYDTQNILTVSPNPFNATTTINVALPANSSDATLRVFDTQGKLVADLTSLLNEKTIRFNAESLGAGLYIIKLNTGDKVYIKKLSFVD
jgi:hypothetical protein